MIKQRIVIGIDGSEEASQALSWAAQEAKLRDATLHVVHVWDAPWHYWEGPVNVDTGNIEVSQRELLDKELAKAVPNPEGLDINTEVVNDLPARALLDRAKGADMIVVGSRGRGGFVGLLLGSVSQQIVNHAECPVVVIPVDKSRAD